METQLNDNNGNDIYPATRSGVTTTQLKDSQGNNVYPVTQGGGGETVGGPIRILVVGNSFAHNAVMYLSDICQNLGVDDVNVQYLLVSGATLQQWASHLGEDDTTIYSAGNEFRTAVDAGDAYSAGGNLYSILHRDWTYIVFQQASSYAGAYSSYQPYLSQLIAACRNLCTNPNVRFAWHMVWETQRGYMGNVYYSDIVVATKDALADQLGDFDIVIANGTAVQNLRSTSLNNDVNNFSADDGVMYHLAWGAGCYTANCTFYEALVKPLSSAKTSITEDDTEITFTNPGTGQVPVTDANRTTLHRCAVYAVSSPWAVTPVSTLEPST